MSKPQLTLIHAAARNITEAAIQAHPQQSVKQIEKQAPIKRKFLIHFEKFSKNTKHLPDPNPLVQVIKFGPNLVCTLCFPNSSLSIQIPIPGKRVNPYAHKQNESTPKGSS